jgi:hypothetical protein
MNITGLGEIASKAKRHRADTAFLHRFRTVSLIALITDAVAQSIYERLAADGRLYIATRDANHYTFSADGASLKSELARRTLHMLSLLGIGGGRQLAVTAYCGHSFFDARLKCETGAQLKIPSASYPEIETLQ